MGKKKEKKKKFKKFIREQLQPAGTIHSALSFLEQCGLVNSLEDDLEVHFDDDVAEIDVFGTTIYLKKEMSKKEMYEYLIEKANEIFNNLKVPKDIYRRDKIVSLIVKEFTRKGFDPVVEDKALKIVDGAHIYFLFTEEDNNINGLQLISIGYDTNMVEEGPFFIKPFEDNDLDEKFHEVMEILEKFVNGVTKLNTKEETSSELGKETPTSKR